MSGHKVTLSKSLPDRTYVRVTADTTRGYFSVTGEVYEPHGTWSGEARFRNGRDCDGAGQCGEIAHFPEMVPIMRVHLCDMEGVPMHAEANGWYWYELGALDTVEKLLRLPYIPRGLSRAAFAEMVDSMRPVWREDARRALEVLDSLT